MPLDQELTTISLTLASFFWMRLHPDSVPCIRGVPGHAIQTMCVTRAVVRFLQTNRLASALRLQSPPQFQQIGAPPSETLPTIFPHNPAFLMAAVTAGSIS